MLTSLGAYECYCVWKAAKGETADPLSAWQGEILTSRFRGTTYAKVNDPFAAYDTITAYFKTLRHHVVYQNGAMESDLIYARDKLASSDPYAVFLNGIWVDRRIRRRKRPASDHQRFVRQHVRSIRRR